MAFNPKSIKRIGILTSGGDAPALNAVIRAAVKSAVLMNGKEVYGIRDGLEGLVVKNGIFPLSLADVRGILPLGGTILGTKNTGNFDCFFDGSPESDKHKIIKKSIRTLKKHKIDAMMLIGGEGSLSVAEYFHQANFPVVGVPKTIDNDLASTDYTFGFDTAVSVATDAIDRLTTTAESHGRVMILELMGRSAGWISLSSGIAGGADIILIPEIPFTVANVAKHIHLRESTGAHSHIIVIAEGACPKGKKPQFYKAAKGKLRLGGIGDWLALELSKKVNSEIRTTVLGHIQRGGKPTSFDRVLASRFGSYAIKMIMNGNFGRMVALQTPDIRSVSLSEAVSHYHTVDPNSGLIRTGRALGLAFGD